MGSLKLVERRALGAVAILAAALAPAAPAAAQDDAVDQGVDWLRVQQRSDGLWGFDERLTIRDSAEVLRALESLGSREPALLAVREALAAQPAATVDLEARLLEALRPSMAESLLTVSLAELASMRSRQGGWGITAGFETADALDTALALRALVGTSYLGASELLAAVNVLTSLQNPDGGYGQVAGEISDLKTSAEVLLALARVSRVGSVDSLSQPLVQFLLAQQMPDGGFPVFVGGSDSDARTTALVLGALVVSGANLVTQYPAARSFLGAHQLPNGSWEDSAYTTALAVAALGGTLPDLLVSKAEFTPSTVPRGAESLLKVTLANLGLADAAQSSLSVYFGDPKAGGALLKTLAVSPLAAGAMTTVQVSISTMLTFEDSLAYFVVADPENKVAEGCETNNRGFAMLEVSGHVQPPPPNLPPVITSVPPTRAMVGTVYTYQVVAVDPEGDPLWYSAYHGPAGLSIDFGTGLVTWVVDVPAGTRVPVGIGACDVYYAGRAQAWVIEVVDTDTKWPPFIDSVPSSTGVVGETYLYELAGTDPDGSPVTFVLVSGPPGMVLNPNTNVISWTPTAGDTGDKIVHVVGKDAEGATVDQQWTIVVTSPATPMPDLVPVTIDLSQSSTDAQSLHRDGAIVVTVANQGTGSAGAFNLVVYENRDGVAGYAPAADRILGQSSSALLASNAKTQVVVPISGETLFRDNRVAVYVDPENAVQELREDNNGDLSGNGTRFVSTPGPFRASIKWRIDGPSWVSSTGFHNPIALAPLHDDNGDGKIGQGDIADVIAMSFNSPYSHVYDGRTGAIVWEATDAPYNRSPTIADADGDGQPELYNYAIFTTGGSNTYPGVFVRNPDRSVRWTSGTLLTPAMVAAGFTSVGNGSADIVVADLEGDGKGEIITRTSIIEHDGVRASSRTSSRMWTVTANRRSSSYPTSSGWIARFCGHIANGARIRETEGYGTRWPSGSSTPTQSLRLWARALTAFGSSSTTARSNGSGRARPGPFPTSRGPR